MNIFQIYHFKNFTYGSMLPDSLCPKWEGTDLNDPKTLKSSLLFLDNMSKLPHRNI